MQAQKKGNYAWGDVGEQALCGVRAACTILFSFFETHFACSIPAYLLEKGRNLRDGRHQIPIMTTATGCFRRERVCGRVGVVQ